MEEIAKFIGTLMASRTQAHVFHLQTQSYAAHKALQTYYEDIVDLIDAYAEAAQGRYGIITGYAAVTMPVFEDNNPLKYFTGLQKFVDNIRDTLPQDGELNNTIDEVSTLIASTMYKLKFLK
jgi:DNA-binding ferritin-like protein